MATNATPVTAAEKDQPGVIETKTFVEGVGDLSVYVKVEKVDDVDSKTTEDVETLKLSVPVEAYEEVEETDEEGNTKEDDEGNPVMKKERFFKVVHYELDMGKASRDKLEKALAPFLKNAREVQAPVVRPSQGTLTAAKSSSPHDLAAIREWAKGAGHEVKEKGRIAANIIAAYYKSTGKPNPEEA